MRNRQGLWWRCAKVLRTRGKWASSSRWRDGLGSKWRGRQGSFTLGLAISERVIVGGSRNILARWLTVLIALVAQGMALMSPVCLVRCVGADGYECIELTGHGCHCCDCQTHNGLPQVCTVATGGHPHDDEQESDHEHEVPMGWQARCEHCACQHSPLEARDHRFN